MVELNSKHFEMLRIAKLRNLKVRRIGEETFAVTSFTRPGLEWVVTADVCTCPSRSYCTHRAAAVDYFYTREADPARYDAYNNLNADDRLQLRLRIRSGETTRNDRIYIAYAMKVYESKRAAFTATMPIRTVTATLPNGRTKARQFVGPYQI